MSINPRQRPVFTTPAVIFPFNLSEVFLNLAEGFEDGRFYVLSRKPAVEVNQSTLAAVYVPEVIPVNTPTFKKKRFNKLVYGRIFIQ